MICDELTLLHHIASNWYQARLLPTLTLLRLLLRTQTKRHLTLHHIVVYRQTIASGMDRLFIFRVVLIGFALSLVFTFHEEFHLLLLELLEF